jgi:L-amino acid N-acyltransferase YncA
MPVRDCTPADIPAICAIYNHYIANTVITFEESPVSEGEMQKRVDAITRTFPWLVYDKGDGVIGYAYASQWKDRSAYKHTAEVTVYLHPDHCEKGVGSRLYQTLIERLTLKNIHVLLACIAIPNIASEKIHNRFGFRQVAHFSEVGFKFGRWVDVGYWQKNL